MKRKMLYVFCLFIGIFFVLYAVWRKSAPNNTFTPRYNRLSQQKISYQPILPSLEKIFSKNHDWTATLSANRITTVVATGDIIPARVVNFSVVQKNDPLWPYEKVIPKLRSLNTDITFVNLEAPLLESCQPTREGMIFCGTEKNIEGLKAIGADVISIANNHAGNYGLQGIQETKNILAGAGMQVTGSSSYIVKNARGIRFAFLGYNDIGAKENGISRADKETIKTEVQKAKQNADIVVVAFHFGAEYQSQPDERQKNLGRFAIDEGADLIIGNHPHWIQPIELYKGRLIAYAHGNFIFDQMWSQKTREGVIGKYTFFDKSLIDVEYFPLIIQDYGQAEFLEGVEKTRILDEMQKESLTLQRER